MAKYNARLRCIEQEKRLIGGDSIFEDRPIVTRAPQMWFMLASPGWSTWSYGVTPPDFSRPNHGNHRHLYVVPRDSTHVISHEPWDQEFPCRRVPPIILLDRLRGG